MIFCCFGCRIRWPSQKSITISYRDVWRYGECHPRCWISVFKIRFSARFTIVVHIVNKMVWCVNCYFSGFTDITVSWFHGKGKIPNRCSRDSAYSASACVGQIVRNTSSSTSIDRERHCSVGCGHRICCNHHFLGFSQIGMKRRIYINPLDWNNDLDGNRHFLPSSVECGTSSNHGFELKCSTLLAIAIFGPSRYSASWIGGTGRSRTVKS